MFVQARSAYVEQPFIFSIIPIMPYIFNHELDLYVKFPVVVPASFSCSYR